MRVKFHRRGGMITVSFEGFTRDQKWDVYPLLAPAKCAQTESAMLAAIRGKFPDVTVIE